MILNREKKTILSNIKNANSFSKSLYNYFIIKRLEEKGRGSERCTIEGEREGVHVRHVKEI